MPHQTLGQVFAEVDRQSQITSSSFCWNSLRISSFWAWQWPKSCWAVPSSCVFFSYKRGQEKVTTEPPHPLPDSPKLSIDIKTEPAHLLLVQKLLQIGLVLWGLRISQELQVLDFEGL